METLVRYQVLPNVSSSNCNEVSVLGHSNETVLRSL